ncbi:spore germination protein [Caloramator proteoclasticus]|uniref:GerA spore germination protein n=1 Tax=Caloramator proteoclasticus DSM 10124 TaxID=1121262 RepID=A0A1M5C210_9CLOT|nr:spore germination protein [Caloramator proteoclasticus]SHF48690.1 GerA spore germination protein [Caloramator proteoclasticus DSM 10124]
MIEQILVEDFNKNLTLISNFVAQNSNFIKKEILINSKINAYVLFIDGLADKNYVEEAIIKPFLYKVDIDIKKEEDLYEASKKYLFISSFRLNNNAKDIGAEILSGKTAVIVDGIKSAMIIDTINPKYRDIQESTSEKSILGIRESFTENIDLNITLIQRKIKSPNLKIERFVVGEKTRTECALVYLEDVIDKELLNTIKSRVLTLKAPAMLTTGVFEQFIERRPFNLFPQAKNTERSDKVVFDLLEGKAAIFVAESPTALIVPATFIEFFQGFEDYSERLIIANFSRIARFIAVITVLILGPIYLTLLLYNAELFPYQLMMVIIDSRKGIPLPPFLEILAMELCIEILREGGVRLPNPVGTTLAIVGGIVIGDAATKANIVSHATLFVVAITVVSTFLIPNYQMALSIRFLRFPMLVLAQLFGFYGILVGFYILLVALVKLDSFGIPYFSPMAPSRFKDFGDVFVRDNIRKIFNEPVSLKPSLSRRNKDE